MSYLTDDTMLPASSLDSGSENSSVVSVASSIDQPIKSYHFLNNSWPFLDRFSDQYSIEDVDSWGNSMNYEMMDGGVLDQYSVSAKPVTRQSSPNSSGCSADASTLYSYRGNHYNPSSSGHRTGQELEDCIQWINGYLQYSTHDIITDLTESFADGLTLLYLVELLLGVVVTPVHIKPALEVQKTENIQKCLDVLTSHGISIHDVTTEDILKKNAKIVLALCQSLRKHFGSLPVSPRISPRGPRPSSSSSRDTSTLINQRLDGNRQSSTPSQSPRAAVIDIEDVAILEWVSNMTNHTLKGYESFQDGHVLCVLVNKLTNGAVPDVVLEHGLPSEKISLALTFSEEELGTTTKIEPYDIIKHINSTKLSLYLQELHKIFLDQKHKEIADSEKAIKDLVQTRESLKETKARELKSTNNLIRNGQETLRSTERVDDEGEMRILTENSSFPLIETHNTGHQMQKSTPENLQTGQQERSQKNRHFLDYNDKNLDDIDRVWPNQYSELNYEKNKRNNLKENLDKTRKTINGKTCYDTGDDALLLPRETIFDPIKWELPYKPLATRSWKKEREKARLKINFLEEQLKLLKKQYFDYTALDYEKDNSEVSGENGTEISTCAKDNCPVQSDPCQHKPAKSSSKGLSESFNSYFGKNNGTTPPYRTWSMYINTEGDRYKTLMKTKAKPDVQLSPSQQNHVTTSSKHSPGISDKDHVVSSDDVNRRREIQKPLDNCTGVISPQIKEIRNTEARDLTKKRLSDASVSSTDSLLASGRRLHGITALVRLSSKKANAVSDTES